MRNRTAEYPRPVLNEYLNDFTNSRFEVVVNSFDDKNNDTLIFDISYILDCFGIAEMITRGDAKVVVRATCFRTSYREAFDLSSPENNLIEIPKNRLSGNIDFQGIIIATHSHSNYKLPEFNNDYFENFYFSLRKGDVLANEPGIKVELNTVFEKNVAGVVMIALDDTIKVMKVKYATTKEDDPKFNDYITVLLPRKDFVNYQNLTRKRHFKYGTERFLQSALILPALVEAISKIKDELDLTEETREELSAQYCGTVWANSVIEALRRHGIEDVGETFINSVELANLILNDVVSDSLNNLMRKMQDWSNIRQDEN